MHVDLVMTLLFATSSEALKLWDQDPGSCCRPCPPVANRSNVSCLREAAFVVEHVDGPDLPSSLLCFWKKFFKSQKDGRILFARGPIEIVAVSQQEAVISLKALLHCRLQPSTAEAPTPTEVFSSQVHERTAHPSSGAR